MTSPYGGKLLKTFEEITDTKPKTVLETTRHGVVAGVAGGLAEIAWITLCAGATGVDPATLARGVTTAAGMSALFPAVPVALGVSVHMALAVTLGIVLSFGWRAVSSYRSGYQSISVHAGCAGQRLGSQFLRGAADHQSCVCSFGAVFG